MSHVCSTQFGLDACYSRVTAGVSQYEGDLSNVVSRYKAINVAWRDCDITLITRNEYGCFFR